MSRPSRIAFAVGLAAAVSTGAALAQQPPSDFNQGMPAGHPPIAAPARPDGQPVVPPANFHQIPVQPGAMPGRPIGPGGQPLPPGHQFAIPGHSFPPGFPPGARMPRRPQPEAEEEHKGHDEEECPGHGPEDPPPPINWWHGIVGINNEKAGAGGLSSLLWRYQNESDPCDEKNEPPPFLAAVLNFGVLAFVVYRFGKKPLAEALVKRKQSIMQEIDNATRLKKEASERLETYEAKLQRLEETLAEMKTEFATQADKEKAHVLAEAEQRRDRMRRDAEFRVEQELKAAKEKLLQEAVQNAVAAAEELLRKRAAKDDLDRIAEDYLRAIPAAVGAGAPRGSHSSGAAT